MKAALSAAAIAMLSVFSFAIDKSIYGADNRLDYFAASQEMRTISDSVVSLWKFSRMEIDTMTANNYSFKTINLEDEYNLCPGEKFRDQPTGAFCSGALVGEDLIMTAGHCIKTEADCQDSRFVFGYAVKKAGAGAVTSIAREEVYGCAGISVQNTAANSDYALIRLDRKVTGHLPLPVNRADTLRAGDGVFVIGHPLGLPLKVAGGASVRRNIGKQKYFVTDLDTFGGNSGSPVFNARTKLIEGIHVRGDAPAFQKSPAGCDTAVTYTQAGGIGAIETKISSLSSLIPKLPQELIDTIPRAIPPINPIPFKEVSFD